MRKFQELEHFRLYFYIFTKFQTTLSVNKRPILKVDCLYKPVFCIYVFLCLPSEKYALKISMTCQSLLQHLYTYNMHIQYVYARALHCFPTKFIFPAMRSKMDSFLFSISHGLHRRICLNVKLFNVFYKVIFKMRYCV